MEPSKRTKDSINVQILRKKKKYIEKAMLKSACLHQFFLFVASVLASVYVSNHGFR